LTEKSRLPLLMAAAAVVVASTAYAGVDNLRLLGRNTQNFAHLMDVEVVGDRAFVCNGLGSGLEVYDITNPSSPSRTWTDGPDAWRARSYGDTVLFLFCRLDGVVLYDISGTGNPVRGGQYDPPGNREALEGGALVGSRLYVAAHQNGIYEIDVSNPNSLQKTGAFSLAPEARAWNVEARDSFLFVANGRHGLAVVGIEGGLHLVTRLELPGLANDIVLDGDVAALSLGAHGLVTVDLSDPHDPVLLDTVPSMGSAWGLGISGKLVICGSWRYMELFDITDPTSITLAGWDNTRTWAHGADIRDDSVIAVADWRGMACYRVGPDPGADIDIRPEVVDFGTVGDSDDTTVVVYNRGAGRLDVVSVETPTGISVEPDSFSVGPGDSAVVTVTASGPGQLNEYIEWGSNDPDRPEWNQEVYKNNTAFPQQGSLAPDFDLEDTEGNLHSLSGCRGKVVYIQFGASW